MGVCVVTDEDAVAVGALRRLRAAVRAGVSPKRRAEAVSDEPRSGADDPTLVGEAVRAFMRERGLDDRHRVARVLEDWPTLVGPEVAQHVRVEAFDDGALLLRADSTTWANQMRLLQATVLRRLGEELGADVVASITVLGPDAPSWRHGARRVPGRGPRDTYG